jgi:acylphosphatase
MKTLHAIVSGRVQGVGFRYFVEEKALCLGLNGWVRNLRSGQVEVLATGEEEDIDRFLSALKRGPGLSKVTHVEVDWGNPPSEEPFHTRSSG